MTKDSVELSSDEEELHNGHVNLAQDKLNYEHNNGVVELHLDSLNCLDSEKYLNDSIIEFYTAYLTKEICPDEVKQRIHIFDSIFYSRLMEIFPQLPPEKDRGHDDENGKDTGSGPKNKLKLLIDQTKWHQLGKWLNGLDVFGKEFLIFPVCLENHWFAIVVCYPANVPYYDDDSQSPENDTNRDGPKPAIIVMDSLNLQKQLVTMCVREFLDFEWRSKLTKIKDFAYCNLEQYHPRLLKQSNAYDCGLYMLAYIRCFIKEPDRFCRLVRDDSPKSKEVLNDKISECLSDTGRESIKSLIHRVCKNKSPTSTN